MHAIMWDAIVKVPNNSRNLKAGPGKSDWSLTSFINSMNLAVLKSLNDFIKNLKKSTIKSTYLHHTINYASIWLLMLLSCNLIFALYGIHFKQRGIWLCFSSTLRILKPPSAPPPSLRPRNIDWCCHSQQFCPGALPSINSFLNCDNEP